MKNETPVRKVTELRLTMCSHGFRSGYAYALVEGVLQRLHTSRCDQTDYNEHASEVRALFESGNGEVVS